MVYQSIERGRKKKQNDIYDTFVSWEFVLVIFIINDFNTVCTVSQYMRLHVRYSNMKKKYTVNLD